MKDEREAALEGGVMDQDYCVEVRIWLNVASGDESDAVMEGNSMVGLLAHKAGYGVLREPVARVIQGGDPFIENGASIEPEGLGP